MEGDSPAAEDGVQRCQRRRVTGTYYRRWWFCCLHKCGDRLLRFLIRALPSALSSQLSRSGLSACDDLSEHFDNRRVSQSFIHLAAKESNRLL
jgi:hypothetical protein